MLATEASLNQGKSLNDMNISLSRQSSQMPCRETLITSTSKVLAPGGSDLISMLLHNRLGLTKLSVGRTKPHQNRPLNSGSTLLGFTPSTFAALVWTSFSA